MGKRKGIKKSNQLKPERCPYCGSTVTLRSADGIYKENKDGTKLYVCSKYPQCDAYVRVHAGTDLAVGVMANQELRTLHRTAHQAFDRLYLSGIMTKREAYQWLAGILQAPLSQAHIGYLREYYCKVVIKESEKVMKNRRVYPSSRGLPKAAGGE